MLAWGGTRAYEAGLRAWRVLLARGKAAEAAARLVAADFGGWWLSEWVGGTVAGVLDLDEVLTLHPELD